MISRGQSTSRPRLADLTAAEWQLAALFRSDAAGVFILSRDNRYVRVSPRWCAMLGYTEEELLRTDPARVTHPDDYEATAVACTRLFEGSADSYRMEKRYVRKDGSALCAEVTVEALRDASGELQGVLAVAVDVTECREALSQLRESEARYRGLLENVRDAVWRADLSGRVTFVTPRCLALLGYEPEEMLGVPAVEAIVEAERGRAAQWLRSIGDADHSQSLTMEFTHQRKDGTQFLGEVRVAPIRDEGGAVTEIQGITRDVTGERAAERQLQLAGESERRFRGRLIALHEMTIALSSVPSTEELCRRAIEFGHNHLGFARLSVWFLDNAAGELVGSFGIDEEGQVRDERQRRHAIPPDSILRRMERDHGRWVMSGPGPLLDDRGGVVGEGWSLRAPLWDGERVVGIAYADNYGSDRPLTEQEGELLVLFASAVGHLHSRLTVESALRATEGRYRAVVDDQTEYIIRCTPEGSITFANPAFGRLVGVPSAEAVGRHLSTVGFGRAWRDLAACADSGPDGSAVSIVEREWPGLEGETRWIRWSRRALRDCCGNVVEYQTVGMDLTAQRQMDAELRVRQTAIESALHGVAILDADGHLTYANRACLSLLGRAGPADLLGSHVSELFGSAITAARLVSAVRREGTWSGELCGLRGDGGAFVARVSASLIREPDGQPMCILAWVEDVTEAKRVREEQERVSAHLRQAQQAETLGVLAGGVAHDLNNIMLGVIGCAQLSLEHLPTGSDSRRLIEQVESAAWRAANLARQMLAYAGRGRNSSENVNLSSLVRGMESLLASTVSKKTHLVYDLADGLPTTVADPVQIEQIALNLILNAAEALRERSGAVVVSTGVQRVEAHEDLTGLLPSPPKPGDYVVLQVEDSGVGMDERTQSRIFEPFYSTKATGRGLGLAAAMGIVRSHGGAVSVQSAPGVGTCFRVLLPVGARPAAATPETEQPTSPAHKGGGPAVVLVADDDEVVRRNACVALEMAGHTALLAEDGLSAVEVFRSNHRDVDLLLLDMMMPGLSGDEVCAQVRGLRPGVPVILCSGFDERIVEASEALAAGDRVTFLHKPYSLTELTECVSRCLAR